MTWKGDRSFRNRLPLALIEIGFKSVFSIEKVVWARAHLSCLDSKTRLCGSCSSRWDSTTVTLLTWFPFYEPRCDSPVAWVKLMLYFEILRCYYLRIEKISMRDKVRYYNFCRYDFHCIQNKIEIETR